MVRRKKVPTKSEEEDDVDAPQRYGISKETIQTVLKNVFGPEVLVNEMKISTIEQRSNTTKSVFMVDVVLQRNKNTSLECFNVVAKTVPRSRFTDPPTKDYGFQFIKREMYFYQTMLPVYKQIELTYGLKTNELQTIAPTLIDWRLSENPHATSIDTSAMIVLENLGKRGFYRITGDLDFSHAIVAMKCIAKFHAIGMAILRNNVKYQLFQEGFSYKNANLGVVVQPLINDPTLRKYAAKFKSALLVQLHRYQNNPTNNNEILSICHGKLGTTRNFQFHLGSNRRPEFAAMIDFQDYMVSSPFRDFTAVMFGCLCGDVMQKRIKEVIDIYHDELTLGLKKLNIAVNIVNRQIFEAKLKEAALLEFPILAAWFQNDIVRMRNIVRLYLYKRWVD